MKKIVGLVILASIVGGIFFMSGCKKGENDPFFSIYSRKKRVTGDWTFSSVVRNTKTVYNNGETAVEDFRLNGESITVKIDSINTVHDTTIVTTGTVNEATYKFDKNGKMEYVFHYTLVKTISELDEATNWTTTTKTTIVYKDRATGTWDFLKGVDKYKNKERISLVFETFNESVNTVVYTEITDDNGDVVSRTNTSDIWAEEHKYANGESAQIWALDKLKNKEITMMRDIDNLVVGTDAFGNGYTISEKGSETVDLEQD